LLFCFCNLRGMKSLAIDGSLYGNRETLFHFGVLEDFCDLLVSIFVKLVQLAVSVDRIAALSAIGHCRAFDGMSLHFVSAGVSTGPGGTRIVDHITREFNLVFSGHRDRGNRKDNSNSDQSSHLDSSVTLRRKLMLARGYGRFSSSFRRFLLLLAQRTYQAPAVESNS